MSTVKTSLIMALVSKAEADIHEAEATINLMLEKPSAIGEHTFKHYVEDLYNAFEKYHESLELKDTIIKYFSNE